MAEEKSEGLLKGLINLWQEKTAKKDAATSAVSNAPVAPVPPEYQGSLLDSAAKQQPNSTTGVSTKKTTTAKGVSPSNNPRIKSIDPSKAKIWAQDPRNGTIREPVLADQTSAIDEFTQNPVVDALSKAIDQHIDTSVDLNDDDPERENITIANDFTRDGGGDGLFTKADKFRTRNRSDLSPIMGLADYWTKGKSNLAGSYKPPESADAVFQAMMKVRGDTIKQRDDSELNRNNQKINAYDKLVLEPESKKYEALSRIYQSTGKDISGMLKNINTTKQSGENNYASDIAKILGSINDRNGAGERAQAGIDQRAREFNSKLSSEAVKSGRTEDFQKQQDDVLERNVLPKFTGRMVPRKEWNAKTQRAAASVVSFSDYVVAHEGLEKSASSLQEARLKALNLIAQGHDGKDWTDPRLKALYDKFTRNNEVK
jgi:hypothetical protein